MVAAPVTVSRAQIQGGSARAIVTNSGISQRLHRRRRPPRRLDDGAQPRPAALAIDPREVLVASTGVIGMPLPIDDVVDRHPAAPPGAMAGTNGRQAANAIRTTDRFPKLAQTQVDLPGGRVRIGGIAKGAGMIRPDMATTLAHVTMDAEVPHATLRRMLRQAVSRLLQRDLGGRLHQHQRLRVRAGQRRLRRRRRRAGGRCGC